MAESYFIAKVYRQTHSLVIVVPQPVCVTLGLRPGNHVVLKWKNPEGVFVFEKFVPVGAKDGGDREHTDHEDRSGTTPAEIGARR